ncbi:serine/arginine repetitive matrix protein 4 [Rhinatrema bivittatum]|uniref:serine/arginine repetitive matrix protein 4 n=1 Tax=Rhinatrema bivittatum TaxID=194408 RepID=UPI00112D4F0A|nr:serine/arginine repetitive matrix protein 4 [Rhinatrema bivittatum]
MNRYLKGKESKKLNYHKSCSPLCAIDKRSLPAPASKGKKKKKKSNRKKRRRSPSYSPSPVKKKKKKSSKKRKQNRSLSKKRRHSSSSPKRKRKEDRKRRKQSHGRTRKSHRHHRRCRSESSGSRTMSYRSRHREKSGESEHKSRFRRSRHNSKRAGKKRSIAQVLHSHCPPQALQICSFLSVKGMIPQSGNSVDLLAAACQKGGSQEYDSGNDTCSPPSTQPDSSRSKVSEEKGSPGHEVFGHALSSRKPKVANSDSSSDSGNSFASSSLQTKGTALDNLCPDAQQKHQRELLSPCHGCLEAKKQMPPLKPAQGLPLRACSRSISCTSTERSSRSYSSSSRSHSAHHRPSPRYSRSISCSSGKRSYSRSASYSSKSCRKSPGSRISRPRRSPSYSRYSPSRDSEKDCKYGSITKRSYKKRSWRRQRSYSPIRKRRRDSPSHLEARRITSARKRPIPYYRPSPSSCSSISSYSSLFSSWSRSPSRSCSYTSYRSSRSCSSRSRSRNWSRSSGERSRRRSYDSVGSYESLRH